MTKQTDFISSVAKGGVILGSPPTFTGLTDPYKRVWSTRLNRVPNIASFIPGEINILSGEALKENIDKSQEFSEKISEHKGNSVAITKDVEDFFSSTFKGKPVWINSYVEFKPAFFAYQNRFRLIMLYFNKTVSALKGNSVGDVINMILSSQSGSDIANDIGAVKIFLSEGTTISETATNDWNTSYLSGFLDSASRVTKELNNAVQFTILGHDKPVEIDTSDKNSQLNVSGAFGNILHQVNHLHPKMWKGSEFARNYTLKFEFATPYGDLESVVRDVYTPYFALLAFTLPEQFSATGFRRPLVLKVSCPGWFNIEMGAITSMTVERSEQQYVTRYGLSRKITCTLNVIDLFPALAISSNPFGLYYNTSLTGYLAGLAGIDYQRIGAGVGLLRTGVSLIEEVEGRVQDIIGSTGDDVQYFINNKFGLFLN